MKYYLRIILLAFLPQMIHAQNTNNPDILRQALKRATTDSAKCSILLALCEHYTEDNADSSLKYANQALFIARANDRKINEAICLALVGYQLSDLGKYAESFEAFGEALKIAEDPNNESSAWRDDRFSFHQNRVDVLGWVHLQIGFHRGFVDSTGQQIFNFRKALQLSEEVKDTVLTGFASWGLSLDYRSPGKSDSALTLLNTAEKIFQKYDITSYLADVYLTKSDIYSTKGDKNNQLYYNLKGLELLAGTNNTYGLNWAYGDLTHYYLQEKQKDSSLYYAKKNVEVLLARGSKDMGRVYSMLSQSYELHNETDSAYKYQGLALTAIDSVDVADAKNLSEFQKQSFKDQMQVSELEQEKASYQSKIRTNILLGGLFTLLVIAFFLFRNNRQKQKANKLIAQQKEKVESTLTQLQSTQSQLIQSEKMASLGELTAGIAHEIQNPLNFVNNFSEVNKELAEELKSELAVGNSQLAAEIANDIKENSEKINHHGKRADAIVKGMLQHSRSSTGVKEPTDINALCDEYLRLSYHGLRAKDNSFNVTMKTGFDNSIEKINIIPQDIGRVLLNLYNNAFYAVSERRKAEGVGYEPTVSIVTKRSPSFGEGRGEVLITVSDNANGIPKNIVEKIFQPFFTTKPTGQGTGLGLSLSYDIIKAYGGEIKLKTKDGEGTEFVIQLPVV